MTTRLALVTGSSQGLGAALAEHLADQGWNVVACVRTESAAVSIKRAGVEPVLQDVRDPVSEALLATVHGRPIDALVNNAGDADTSPREPRSLSNGKSPGRQRPRDIPLVKLGMTLRSQRAL